MKRIVFIGDCHVLGNFLQNPLYIWPYTLMSLTGIVCSLNGVTGDSSWDVRKRIDAVLVGDADAVCVMAGFNDVNGGRTFHTKENLSATYDAIEESGHRLIVCTLPPIADKPVEEVNRWIRSEAERRGAILFDFYAVLNVDGAPNPALYQDALHPHCEGQRVMANEAKRVLGETE